MANPQNLKPIQKGQLSKEEAKRRGSKGGKKSVEARRKKKSMQELAKEILNMPLKAGDIDDASFLADIVKFDKDGNAIIGENGKPIPKNLTVQQAALMAQANKAVKGDVQALQLLRDTAGEKPVEKVEISNDIQKAAADIQQLISDLGYD